MTRLIQGVTRALVERSPVDWSAVRSRAGTHADRAVIDALHDIEGLRSSTSPASASISWPPGPGSALAAQWILAVALIQVLGSAALLLALRGIDGIRHDHLPQVLLASTFAGGSLFLATCAKRDSRTLYLAAWFACAASAFAKHSVAALPLASSEPVGFALQRVVPEAFMPACVWQFALAFPRVLRYARFDRLARKATVGAWVAGCVLFAVNLAASLESFEPVGLGRLLRDHPGKMFWHIVTLAMAPAVGTIFARARRAAAHERQKVARLAAAMAFGTAPFLVTITLSAISPRLNRWLIASNAGDRLWLDAVVITALATAPVLCSLAVIVDRPFELRAALGWLVRHAVARGVVEALVVVPFATLAFTLYDLRDIAVRDIGGTLNPGLPIACLAAVVFAIFGRSPLLRALDRFESRRRTEHHQELARVIEQLRLARGVREIAEVLKRELQNGTGAATVTVLLPAPSGFATFDESSLTMDARLGLLLRDASAALDVSVSGRLFDLLPPIDRDWMETHDAAMLAAVKHRDDAVAAVVALGPKRGGTPFDDRDIRLITSIAAAAAAAWPSTAVLEADAPGLALPSAAFAPAVDPRLESPRAVRSAGEAAFECPSCGVVVDALPFGCSCGAAPQLAALPHRVGERLVATRRIGAGGMGVVYVARDQVLGRDVALKTLPALAHGAIARLQQEARAMAALNHPALATLFGVEVWQRTPILVVEYFPNGTLADRLAPDGPLGRALTVDDTVRLGITLAGALAYMHARGVLHRDLKPSNIGMTSSGSAKLLDFGLASVRPAANAAASTVRVRPEGTLAYLPPEALEGAAPSPAFDLWALAVVLLECLTGTNLAAARATPIAPALQPFFERALSPDPERRFQYAEDLQEALTRSAT